MFLCSFFAVYGCMLCLVRYLFVISTSVIDCLGRFVPEMTYYMSSGRLNLRILKLSLMRLSPVTFVVVVIIICSDKKSTCTALHKQD